MSQNQLIALGVAVVVVVGLVIWQPWKKKDVKKSDVGHTIVMVMKAPSIIPA